MLRFRKQNKKKALANERAERLAAYDCHTGGFNLGEMDENSFMALLNGAKKTFEDKIEAERKAEEKRLEDERMVRLHRERKNGILHLWNFMPEWRDEECFADFTEDKWVEIVAIAETKKSEHEKEQERIRLENERLKGVCDFQS